MGKLERLIREAKDSCEFREHDMYRFQHENSWAWSECKVCKMSVVVRTNPLPNEIEIGGEAVALKCSGKENVIK